MLILGIESSCDETAAAVLADGAKLLSNVVHSQIAVHGKYGGVVPELASRKHLEDIYPVVNKALERAGVSMRQLDAMAVTQGPGLIGSLLVGLSFTKALALVTGIPYVGVDHMAGHLLSAFFARENPSFPYVALVASGGHTSLFYVTDPTTFQALGRTRDDAAGEAFDKVSKLLGLGYPGGPIIGKLASHGNPEAIPFPRAWLDQESVDFSFSGLKTAVVNYVNRQLQTGKEPPVADICASFQEAVVEVLVEKTIHAAHRSRVRTIVLAGGVAANKRLRKAMRVRSKEEKLNLVIPPPEFCTDNAAMIALAGYHLIRKDEVGTLDMDVYSRSCHYNGNSR